MHDASESHPSFRGPEHVSFRTTLEQPRFHLASALVSDGAVRDHTDKAAKKAPPLHIVADTKFGVMAVKELICAACSGGAVMGSGILAINKLDGSSTWTTVFMNKTDKQTIVQKGTCTRVRH